MHSYNKPLKYNRWEYVVPALTIVSLLVACIIVSNKKVFWNDELYSYYFLSDPSFAKMLAAFHDKINNTPILYFALGWVWDKVFGSSELSYRLFSSLGICAALGLTWVTLRRTYDFWSTSIGVLGVFCTSEIILMQNAEARMYGLFLAFGAVGLFLYDRINREPQPSTRLLLVNAAVQAALVHTHLFGGFYSGAFLVATVVSDRYSRLFRPKVYLSIVLGMLSVLFYIPSFLIQADAGKPRTWIPSPTVQDLIDFFSFKYSLFMDGYVFVLIVSISALLFIYYKFINPELKNLPVKQKQPDQDSETSLLIFAFIFMVALPVFLWLFSKIIKPVMFDKYMIPSILGWVIMLAHFTSRLLIPKTIKGAVSEESQAGAIHRYLYLPAILLLFLVVMSFALRPLFYAKKFPRQKALGLVINPHPYPNLPIVVQPSQYFTQVIHYAKNKDKYFFIRDWEAAMDKHSGRFSPQEYKHLGALKRNYPDLFHNVVYSEEFLNKYNRFLVIDYPNYTRQCSDWPVGLEVARRWLGLHCPQWVETRIMKGNMYKVTILQSNDWVTVLLVEKALNNKLEANVSLNK